MVTPMDAALQSLVESGRATGADARAEDRLAQVQTALAGDLARVEAAIVDASRAGPEPGRLALEHLVGHGGKRVRPTAVLLAAACFGPIPAAAREVAVAVELVHSATLLHDDVIDEGDVRRGAPAARRLWGNAVSVLAGDLALVHALQRTATHAPELLPSLLGTLRQLVDGEIIQLRGRREIDLEEDTYRAVLELKTASLFAWAARSGARVGGASETEADRLAQFGQQLGFAFQLVDDVLDYSGHATGKSLFADLREGKVTLPLIIAVRRIPALAELVRRIHSGDERAVELVSQKVVASGACDEVRRRAKECTDRAVEALHGIPLGPARSLLESSARDLASRRG